MTEALFNAAAASNDTPDGPSVEVTDFKPKGRRGRPRKNIDKTFLQHALGVRNKTRIGAAIGCSSRTVRRRAIDHGLEREGVSVFTTVPQPDGSTSRVWQASGPMQNEVMDDNTLDHHVADVLQAMPELGRAMVMGNLKAKGIKVSRAQVQKSIERVQGLPAQFGRRRLQRRVYSVPGVNSLWHHDGNHGMVMFIILYLAVSTEKCLPAELIRWKIVNHGFIDGYSRLVTGSRFSNNNRSDTVLKVMLSAVKEYGLPSRIRGDHGTENVKVAAYMYEQRGSGRGSYIWGQYVHTFWQTST